VQAVFWLEEHSGGIRGKSAPNKRFEFLKLLARDGTFFYIQLGENQSAQSITLIDGKRANVTARIRDGFEPLALAWRQLDRYSPDSRR
jgi:hypothetical protein